MEPGTVAHFSDGQRVHTGIVLDELDGDLWAVFLTSNPEWNRKCRPASLEEVSLCGFPSGPKRTYLAPVVRPSQDAYETDKLFPKHRVEELSEEFGPSPFAPPAISLPSEMFPDIRSVRPSMPEKLLIRIMGECFEKAGIHDGWSKDQVDRFQRIGSGLDEMSRSELVSICSLVPGLTSFFTRRASVTMGLQRRWASIGSILESYRTEQKVPLSLMARRMGLADREYARFENGLECPSYDEMLTVQAMLPGLPDSWTLPTSVPLLLECIGMQAVRRKMTVASICSLTRIPRRRLDGMFLDAKRPSDVDMKRLRMAFPGLPPWRPCYRELDLPDDSPRIGIHVR